MIKIAMGFSITKSDGEMVVPSEPTPSGVLPLSSKDRVFTPGHLMYSLHVYKHGPPGAAEHIRKALSKALVPYYPMAGRLVQGPEGVEVDCTGQGAWFVQATAECSLQDVGRFEQQPLMIPVDQLTPHPSDSTGMILMMQVTQFACGGFTVCYVSDHTIADGLGTSQFFNAVGEIARGFQVPKVGPIWCRNCIPNPPKPGAGPPLVFLDVEYRDFIVDLSVGRTGWLKSQFREKTGRKCSSFDIVCAVAWRSRTRAIGIKPDRRVYLAFPAYVRHLFDLPAGGSGYYGNCIHPVELAAPSGKIVDASIIEIAGMIIDAKERIPIEFDKWAKGEVPHNPPPSGLESLIVVDYTGLGYNDIDYSWGKPTYVTPLLKADLVGLCIIIKQPAPATGLRLVTQCLGKDHLAVFGNEMVKLSGLMSPI